MGEHAATSLHADELTIQRIATARAIKATRLIYALMSTGEPVTVTTVAGLSDATKAAMVERAGVKVASSLTWEVVDGVIQGITRAAKEEGFGHG